MATPTQKPKRFILSIINPSEDIPRLIRAYGKCGGGELALVLHPTEGRGQLFHVEGQAAKRWQGRGEGGDAPGMPEEDISPGEAVRLTRSAQNKLPKPGPMTLRGQWRGYLYCEEGALRVELIRKISSYGILTITSSLDGHWDWRVERTAKWFSETGDDVGQAQTLAKAIERGLATAMGLLGEACSFRDSRRRAAFDEAYAEKYPLKPAREKKDPTERFKEKPPKKKPTLRKKATTTKTSPTPRAKARQPGPKARQPGPQAQQPDAPGVVPAKDALLMAAFADTLKSLLAGG